MIDLDDLLILFNECNEKYFDNDIESDIRFVLDKRIRAFARTWPVENNECRIDINPKLLRIDQRIIKNTLVHEMIHVWQFENGYEAEENGMHGESFNQWCKYLKRKTGIQISQYSTDYESKRLNSETSCFYVYDESDGWGYFTKILYANEVDKLKRKGFKVYYIKKVEMKWIKCADGNSKKKQFILSPLKFDLDDLPGNQCYKLAHFNANKLEKL